MRRTYRLPEISVKIRQGAEVNPELHLFNSYDLTWPFIIHLGALRVVCQNGLVMGQEFLHLRKRHIYELGQINVAEEVGKALERFNQQTQEWKGWTEKKLAPRAYSKVLEAMKSVKEGETAAIIGEITRQYPGKVFVETAIGGKRLLALHIEEQLPRIC